jgi:hypothetical protein
MGLSLQKSDERPRELRRRVMITARLRTGAEWSDACILNISSRGLMIQSGRTAPEGASVELRRGEHVIVARVMWRDGSRAGLRCDERLPVEEIMSQTGASALRLVASEGAIVERRRLPRNLADRARLSGRLIEFGGVGLFVLCAALCLWAAAQQTLERPLERAEAALAGTGSY